MRSLVRRRLFFHTDLVDEVVEVEVLQVLELGLAGREQLLADLHVGVHRAADVEQQQQLHGVAPFRAHLDVEQAGIAGGVVDGAVAGPALPAAPWRANLRRRRRATLMLRVPSSTWSSRFLYSRWSQTLAALPWRLPASPTRMPSGL